MSKTVLFAGGPLHGRTMAVEDHTPVMYAMDPLGATTSTGTLQAYAVSRFAICGRIIWIGYLGTQPDDDLAFEVLTSDGAKEASYVPVPA